MIRLGPLPRRPAARVADEERRAKVHAARLWDVQVVILHHLAPHAGTRLTEAVPGGGRVQRQGEVQLRQHERRFSLKVGQALEVAGAQLRGRRFAGFLLEGRRFEDYAGLVGEDDEEVAGRDLLDQWGRTRYVDRRAARRGFWDVDGGVKLI